MKSDNTKYCFLRYCSSIYCLVIYYSNIQYMLPNRINLCNTMDILSAEEYSALYATPNLFRWNKISLKMNGVSRFFTLRLPLHHLLFQHQKNICSAMFDRYRLQANAHNQYRTSLCAIIHYNISCVAVKNSSPLVWWRISSNNST